MQSSPKSFRKYDYNTINNSWTVLQKVLANIVGEDHNEQRIHNELLLWNFAGLRLGSTLLDLVLFGGIRIEGRVLIVDMTRRWPVKRHSDSPNLNSNSKNRNGNSNLQVRIYVPFRDRFGILTDLLADENKMPFTQNKKLIFSSDEWMKITHDLKRETEQLRQDERK